MRAITLAFGLRLPAATWLRCCVAARAGEPLSSLSKKFGLGHPDSSSNLIRRGKERSAQSKEYRQAIEDIEWNLGVKTENQA
jgi:hypothetical protein